MVHHGLLPMGSVLQHLEGQLVFQFLPRPFLKPVPGQIFFKPQITMADGSGLEQSPVAEGIFVNISFLHIKILAAQAIQYLFRLALSHQPFPYEMHQKELPAHTPDPRINGACGQGPFRQYGIARDPVVHVPHQLFNIFPFSRQTECQQKFVQVFMAVQHKDPFRIHVGALIPHHLLQGIGRAAGFHIPPVLKYKGLIHEKLRLLHDPLPFVQAVGDHIFCHKCRIILFYIGPGPFRQGHESVLFHSLSPFLCFSRGTAPSRFLFSQGTAPIPHSLFRTDAG